MSKIPQNLLPGSLEKDDYTTLLFYKCSGVHLLMPYQSFLKHFFLFSLLFSASVPPLIPFTKLPLASVGLCMQYRKRYLEYLDEVLQVLPRGNNSILLQMTRLFHQRFHYLY